VFSDSLPLFQQKIPNLRSYSQTSFATEILRQIYDAHNAKKDVTLLQQLINCFRNYFVSYNPVERDYIHLFHFGMFQIFLHIFHGKTEMKLLSE
jgi:hypothetical protein